MNRIEQAMQAKKKKQFDEALQYYQLHQREQGISAGLLHSIAKIYYLKGDGEIALRFHLAATHLTLHMDQILLQNEDEQALQALKRLPSEVRKTLPHDVAGMLYVHLNAINHIAHSLLDRPATWEEKPELQPIVKLYAARVLGDGSEHALYEQYNQTPESMQQVEQKYYLPAGFQYAFQQIKWQSLGNTDVRALYFT